MNIEEGVIRAKAILNNHREIDKMMVIEMVELVETLLTAYEKEKEKNKKIEKELQKHIKFCEQEAEGSLHNEICHISLKFNKKLLNILKKEE